MHVSSWFGVDGRFPHKSQEACPHRRGAACCGDPPARRDGAHVALSGRPALGWRLMTRHPAPRYRASAKRRASPLRTSRHSRPYVLVVALVALAALGWGAWTSNVRAASQKTPAPGRASAEISQEKQDGIAKPVRHVTFGAHTRANEPCASCHAKQPEGEISCRNCHGNVCGKDAKVVSDCLKCHKKGMTDDWTSGAQ